MRQVKKLVVRLLSIVRGRFLRFVNSLVVDFKTLTLTTNEP